MICVLLMTVISQMPGPVAAVTPYGLWVDSRVLRGFEVYSQFPLQDVESTLTDLASLADDLEAMLGLQLGERPVKVFLFQSQTTYQQFLRREFRDVPYRRALYLERSGQAMVLAYRSRELATDLRHEATHALLHGALPVVPLWIDEGLAEYFEVPRDRRASGHSHLKWVRFWAALGYAPSLKNLEQIYSMEAMDGNAYRASWAWVHFFLHGPPEAREEFLAHLRTLQNYGVPGSLAEKTEKRLGSLSAAFLTHFRRW